MKIQPLRFLVFALFLMGCGQNLKEVPMDKFVGFGELKSPGIFDGIQIRIENQDEKFTGKITRLNDNKLVKMFTENGDVWVSDITRNSNFQFRLTEMKLAEDLFSIYGLSTSQESLKLNL